MSGSSSSKVSLQTEQVDDAEASLISHLKINLNLCHKLGDYKLQSKKAVVNREVCIQCKYILNGIYNLH